jgi:hypothetical protein
LARRGIALSVTLLIAETTVRGAGLDLPPVLVDSTVRAAIAVGIGHKAVIGVVSASTAQLTEEVLTTMFLARLKTVPLVVLMACALGAGAAGVLAQQGAAPDPKSPSDQFKAAATNASGASPASDSESAPSFIKQSRVMIVTRLEQELRLAQSKLDRTLERVHSANDPEAARAKKTVDSLKQLIARIDMVLVEAVDRYPTIFDFSGGPSQPEPDTTHKDPPTQQYRESNAAQSNKSQAENGFTRYPDGSKQGQAQQRQGRQEFEGDLAEYEASIARAQSDAIRAQDGVEWAKRMLEKGYVSKSAYDAAVLDHEAAVLSLRAITRSGSRFGQKNKAGAQNRNSPQSSQERQSEFPQDASSRQLTRQKANQSSQIDGQRQDPNNSQDQKVPSAGKQTDRD